MHLDNYPLLTPRPGCGRPRWSPTGPQPTRRCLTNSSRPPGVTMSGMATTGWRPTTAGSNTGCDRCAGSATTEPQDLSSPDTFIQNIRRGHYEIGVDAPPALRLAAAFTELAAAV